MNDVRKPAYRLTVANKEDIENQLDAYLERNEIRINLDEFGDKNDLFMNSLTKKYLKIIQFAEYHGISRILKRDSYINMRVLVRGDNLTEFEKNFGGGEPNVCCAYVINQRISPEVPSVGTMHLREGTDMYNALLEWVRNKAKVAHTVRQARSTLGNIVEGSTSVGQIHRLIPEVFNLLSGDYIQRVSEYKRKPRLPENFRIRMRDDLQGTIDDIRNLNHLLSLGAIIGEIEDGGYYNRVTSTMNVYESYDDEEDGDED